MNKEGKAKDFFDHMQMIKKTIKKSYLYKLISKFLSVSCSIILVLLLIVGGFMFYFNMKAKSYAEKGLEYNTPFGLYTIISGSMEPNVSVYDVVIAVNQDISKIKVGDVITFVSSWDVNYGLTVTHRVIAISKNESGEFQLTTKGDNNNVADGGVVTQNNLIGKVIGRIPQLGRLQFFLATKMGWFLVVFIPALAIIVFDVIKIFRLYVLKNKIDNVKPHKEAVKELTEKQLESQNVQLKDLNSEPLKIRTHYDDTVDTVELPKIDVDGKIKESTSEIPRIEIEEEVKDDVIVLPKLDDEENTSELPKIKNNRDFAEPLLVEEEKVSEDDDETIELPILKKSDSDDDLDIDNLQIQRMMLKNRDK